MTVILEVTMEGKREINKKEKLKQGVTSK